jgi:hypothetical protein
MVTQDVKVSIVPGGVPPRVSLKQWDKGLNTLRFHVYDVDNTPYVIANDTTVSLKGEVIIPGGNSYMLMYNCSFSSNIVSVSVPKQLTLEAGDIHCELCFVDSGGNQTASIDIILDIEKGIPSKDISIPNHDIAYANEVLSYLQTAFATNVLQSTSPFKFKGTVAAQANLPGSGNTINDTYFVSGLGYTMTWNGSAWSRSSYEGGGALSLSYAQRTVIPNGTDLNNLVEIGNYYVGSASNAATIIHGPVSDRAYALSVLSLYQSDRLCQIAFIATEKSPLSIRVSFTGESWGDWYDITDFDKSVRKPIYNPDGKVGQVLRSNGNGETEWVNVGQPTDEQATAAVNAWLDEHPEDLRTCNYDALTATLIM